MTLYLSSENVAAFPVAADVELEEMWKCVEWMMGQWWMSMGWYQLYIFPIVPNIRYKIDQKLALKGRPLIGR